MPRHPFSEEVARHAMDAATWEGLNKANQILTKSITAAAEDGDQVAKFVIDWANRVGHPAFTVEPPTLERGARIETWSQMASRLLEAVLKEEEVPAAFDFLVGLNSLAIVDIVELTRRVGEYAAAKGMAEYQSGARCPASVH